MIGIRADANEIIALGHIMRCTAIAQQLEILGQEVVFITADHFPDKILDKKGLRHICIETDWKDKDNELTKLKQLLVNHDIKALLIDSYEVTERYLTELNQIAKTIYIDDIYKFAYPVNLLINYTRNVKKEIYESLYLQKPSDKVPSFLLGAEYIPLRKEFLNQQVSVREKVKDILITTGGSDALQISYRILKRIVDLKKWKDIRFHIIVGEFFNNVDELHLLAKGNENFIIHRNIENMAEIMKQCDIAISAGGTTLSELCACGIPAICFAFASNQLEGVQEFGKDGIMISFGDIRQKPNQGIDNMLRHMDFLIADYDSRVKYSQKAKAAVDGNGAYRIAKRILQLL